MVEEELRKTQAGTIKLLAPFRTSRIKNATNNKASKKPGPYGEALKTDLRNNILFRRN